MVKEQTEKDYIFSIVMAIYNVEAYLEEAIESVIDQTLDFHSHVQLILVNDGSPDHSESICLKYKDKYPENIWYISKENGGVSSARNEGLKYVKGKYVNFLDPDDKLSDTTLKEVYCFFENHYSETDVVSIPIEYFEARTGRHVLNYKYTSSRIVDLNEEYNHIQLSSSSSFIKSASLQERNFNPYLMYGEDAELLTRIILEKMTLGLVKGVKYFYRSRLNGTSALQTSLTTKSWYLDGLNSFLMSILSYSVEKFEYVPKYVQYLVMYDLQWKFNVSAYPSFLALKEINQFEEKLKEILAHIEEGIIFEQKNLNLFRKMFAIALKHNTTNINSMYTTVVQNDSVLVYYKDTLLSSLDEQSIILEFLEVKNGELILEGFFSSLLDPKETPVFIMLGHRIYETEDVNRKAQGIYSLSRLVKDYKGFRVKVPFTGQSKETISFYIESSGIKIPVKLKFGKFIKLNKGRQSDYFIEGHHLISFNQNGLIIENRKISAVILRELKLYKRVIKEKVGKKVILARLIFYFGKLMHRKKIWLFADRIDKADDNAEALFRYANQQKDDIRKYFVLNKDCDDFNRLKKVGRIVPYGTYRHKILHLMANKVISSHADEWVVNPFFGMYKYYKDLHHAEFVFLQHGITKDDLSGWLNKYKKNIKLFLTAAVPEYESIINNNYGYGSDVVKLLGFPRFDFLENKDKKQILIMPTWRKHLVKELNQQTGNRPYSETFKNSDYFKHYNALVNDTRILEKAQSLEYKIIFFPHPNIQQQIKDFAKNDLVQFASFNTSYQKLFNESSLLITDFSSVAFDFAYLKKPVLYFHYEKNHLKEGYFDYYESGFGEVCKDYDLLVNQILYYMDNNCQMKEQYIKRVNSFYAFQDRNNSSRVYEEVLKMN